MLMINPPTTDADDQPPDDHCGGEGAHGGFPFHRPGAFLSLSLSLAPSLSRSLARALSPSPSLPPSLFLSLARALSLPPSIPPSPPSHSLTLSRALSLSTLISVFETQMSVLQALIIHGWDMERTRLEADASLT